MKTIQLQLVTYDQAKRLKALGFDWKTRDLYKESDSSKTFIINDNPRLYEQNWNASTGDEKIISAPTVSLALKWCREVKGVACGVAYSDKGYMFFITPCEMKTFGNDYDQAESALLDEILNILEKQ